MSALFNCNEATLLIEKRVELPLLAERTSVLCRRYARQTQVVAALAQRLGRADAARDADEMLSLEMQQQLAQLVRQGGHAGPAAS